MHKLKVRQPLLAAMGALVAISAAPSAAFADNASDIQALKDQVKMMQQKLDQLQSTSTTSSTGTPPSGAAAEAVKPNNKDSLGALTWKGITIYGTVDIGVQYISHGAPLSATWGPGLPSFIQNFSNHSITSVNGNGLSQSKVGISGVEPLFGIGDLNGVFRAETGFNPWSGRLVDGPQSLITDNGKAAAIKTSAGDSSRAGQAFNSVAFAGVSSKMYGTLTFGRQNGLMLDLLNKYDPQLQAQAFSPIALSGTSGGLGDTQSNRIDNAIKYQLQFGPARLALLHGFGSDGYVPQRSNEVTVGADYAGFSVDALYGLIHGAVAAASLSGAQITALNNTVPLPAWSVSNTLAATISDNTGYSLQMSYNAKDYFPIKVYAGWERIKYNNPAHTDSGGTIDIGGYQLGAATAENADVDNIVNNSAFKIQKILQISWVGARYSVTPDLDVTGALYGYNQKSYNATGCRSNIEANCAGELLDLSLVADYHFSKRFDSYFGVNWSRVQNGLAAGYLYTSEYSPMLGVRYNF